ncbi:hypothetical protein C8R44DRAFT_894235 [Mycena epipterygia]|nr:hypothetical protein C8R44DRAFT_894235 [Mycena epipterygia]
MSAAHQDMGNLKYRQDLPYKAIMSFRHSDAKRLAVYCYLAGPTLHAYNLDSHEGCKTRRRRRQQSAEFGRRRAFKRTYPTRLSWRFAQRMRNVPPASPGASRVWEGIGIPKVPLYTPILSICTSDAKRLADVARSKSSLPTKAARHDYAVALTIRARARRRRGPEH